nr:gliding motility-associated C-terminal domain-containing protein [Bacteroidota bacterium]
MTCNSNNGNAVCNATGGTGTFTFVWSNSSTNDSIFNLAPGTYTVTVTDINNCTATQSVTINSTLLPVITVSNIINVNCKGGDNGLITVTVAGGVPPYVYSWSNGNTTAEIDTLTAGLYILTVTDFSGCSVIDSIVITEPDLLQLSLNSYPVSCLAIDGAIKCNVLGGTAPYTYLWSNSATTDSIFGLNVGTYTVTVIDIKGCVATLSGQVVKAPDPQISLNNLVGIGCSGLPVGSIDIAVSGGTIFTYLWSNGASTQDINTLLPNTYTVTVTNEFGCTSVDSFIVTGFFPIVLSTSITNETCGAGNGTATVTAAGGNGVYTYLWSNGQTTSTTTGLVANTYTVLVSDTGVCSNSKSVTIINLANPVVTNDSIIKTLCSSSIDGAIYISVSGNGPFTYLWTGGSTLQDLINVASGSYTVTVTDTNSCVTTANFTIAPTLPLNLNMNAVSASCGVANGYAFVQVSLGTAPYTYLWTGGATTDTISNLVAATYSVTVTDKNGCSDTASVVVNASNQILYNVDSVVNVNCNGDSTGAIYVNVVNASVFSYQWSNGATTSNLLNVPAGIYTLSITGPNGCFADTTLTISQPLPIISNITSTPAGCTLAYGTATVNPTGGNGAYTYLWSSGSTLNTAVNLLSGYVSVTISDVKGCTLTDSVYVGISSQITVTSDSLNNPKCAGGNDGAIYISVNNGILPYTFIWSNGVTSEDNLNIPGGAYTVIVTDSVGCADTVSYNLFEPNALSLGFSSTPPSCIANNGSITVSVSGGTPLYTYLWSNGATDDSIFNLSPSWYTVTVTDANGCTIQDSLLLSIPGAPVLSIDSVTNVICGGAGNGAIYITTTGGTSPFNYLWSNGATDEDLLSVAGGTYTVNVTDANGCSFSLSATISENTVLQAQVFTQNAGCNSNNGFAYVVTSGGTPPYTINWLFNGSSQDTIASLFPGSYDVVVTDSNGCTTSATGIVNNSNAASIIPDSIVGVSCFGLNDGAIYISTIGGVAPFNYLWNNGNTNEDITGLAQGIYTVTVTDILGCITIFSDTVTQPDSLQFVFTVDSASCNIANGSASLVVSGGTSPYTYNWSNGSQTQSINGVLAGIYTVTVTDAHGCSLSSNVIVPNYSSPYISSSSVTGLTCFGSGDGFIDITISGGSPPFSFLWNDGNTNEDRSTLSAGTYTVTVTDIHNCTALQVFVVSEPSDIVFSIQVQDANCNTNDGSATVTGLFGGVGPYTFLWSNSVTISTISNVFAGTYTITVTDAKGCTKTGIASIGNISGPVITIDSISNILCFGGSNGYISVSVSGGNPGYTFLWSNGGTTNTISNLTAGTYNLAVTDIIGCKDFYSVNFLEPAEINLNPVLAINNPPLFNISCNGAGDGSIVLSVTGGAFPYSYSWTNGASTSAIYNLSATLYQVQVTDANGCIKKDTFLLTEPPPLMSIGGSDIEICGEDSVHLNATAPTYGYGFWSVLNGTGVFDDDKSPQAFVSGLSFGVNTFMWIVADSSSCKDTSLVIVNMLEQIDAIAGSDREICDNQVVLSATAPQFGFGLWSTFNSNGIIQDTTQALTNAFLLNVGSNVFQWTVYNGGCKDSDFVNIIRLDSLDCLTPIDLPTGFSPNGDGTNDNYVVKGILDYPDNILIVYNRWGNIVYQKTSYANEWKGTNNNGENLPEGTYYVTIKIKGYTKYANSFIDLRR